MLLTVAEPPDSSLLGAHPAGHRKPGLGGGCRHQQQPVTMVVRAHLLAFTPHPTCPPTHYLQWCMGGRQTQRMAPAASTL